MTAKVLGLTLPDKMEGSIANGEICTLKGVKVTYKKEDIKKIELTVNTDFASIYI